MCIGTETMLRSISLPWCWLTHWGQVMHIWVSRLTIIGLDNGLWPGWHHVIIWTNAGKMLIGRLWTNPSAIFNHNWCIFIQENAFENVFWEMVAILSWPQCVNTSHYQNHRLFIVNWTIRNIFHWSLNKTCSLKEMYWKMPSGEWQPFCSGLNVMHQ